MKAITLWQPWASLIADRKKKSETRHWPPPRYLVGQTIAIHAGKRVERDYCEDFGYLPDGIPRGAVVCYARLSGAAQVGEIDPLGYLKFRRQPIGDCPAVVKVDKFGDYSPGRWLWFLEDVQKLPAPIQARGSQGIWTFHQ